ncbi:hypothetical protein EBZ80_08405 [bacterium]|nr:hypothetical protein [bacterium]
MLFLWSMVVCFSCGIACGSLYGMAVLLVSVVWSYFVSSKIQDSTMMAPPRTRFLVVIALSATFLWGQRHHGSFRSPAVPGPVRIVATGTPHVWKGAAALVEDKMGAVLVMVDSPDTRSPQPDLASGWQLPLKRCGPGSWLRPSRCALDAGSKARHTRRWLASLRGHMVRYLGSFGPSAGSWLKALILGIAPNGHGGLLEAFRSTGLLHFIVVSGSHITLIHRMFTGVFSVPASIGRALFPGIVIVGRFQGMLPSLLAVIPVVAFSLIAGLDPPVQRAICSLVVAHGFTMAGSRIQPAAIVPLTCLLQASLWPVGFLSRSNMLSWVAWIIVLLVRPDPTGFFRLSGACLRQVLLMLAMSVLFGISCSVGIIANLVFLPVLEVLFIISIFICAAGPRLAGLMGFDGFMAVLIDIARQASSIAATGALARLDAALSAPAVRLAMVCVLWASFSGYAASTLVGSTGKVDVPP